MVANDGEADMRTALIYALAALGEIAGCFAVWQVLRRDAPTIWLLAGAGCLAAFAWLLARNDQAFAGRAFAAYGGVYVAGCLLWLWLVEGAVPSRTDLLGGAIVLAGSAVIVWGGRG